MASMPFNQWNHSTSLVEPLLPVVKIVKNGVFLFAKMNITSYLDNYISDAKNDV